MGYICSIIPGLKDNDPQAQVHRHTVCAVTKGFTLRRVLSLTECSAVAVLNILAIFKYGAMNFHFALCLTN